MRAKTVFDFTAGYLKQFSEQAVLHRKKIFWAISVAVLCIALWQLPYFLLSRIWSPIQIKKTLSDYALNSKLSVTYDGLSADPFTGITIHNPRISWEADFNKGRIFFIAPSLKLKSGFFSLFGNMLPAVTGVQADKAEFNIFFDDGKIPANVTQQIEQWLVASDRITISCFDCRAKFYFKSGSYRKEIWLIENIRFTSDTTELSRSINLQYDSKKFGDGRLSYFLPACFPQKCVFGTGEIYWEGKNLNLEILNVFFKEWEFRESNLSGKLQTNRQTSEPVKGKHIPENDLITLKGNFEIPQIRIWSEEEIYYSEENITSAFQVKRENGKWYTDISGVLRNRDYSLKIQGLSAAVLPDSWSVKLGEVVPGKGNDSIRLPYDLSLSGLKKFHIDMTPYKKTDYRIVDTAWEIYNGSIQKLHKGNISIPLHLDLFRGQLKEDKLTTELTARYLNTSLRAELGGQVYVRAKNFSEVSDYLRRNAPTVSRQIFVFESKLKGLLRSDRIFYADLEPEIKRAKLWWDTETISGLQYSWMTPKFREREIFARLLQYLNLDMTIEMPVIDYNNGAWFGLTGVLQSSSGWLSTKLDINSPDKKNYIYFNASYMTNFPYITFESRLELPNSYPLLRPWLPPEFFEHFSDAVSEFAFNGMGERPTGLYLSGRAAGTLSARNVRLGEFAVKSQLPLQWENLNVKFDSHKDAGSIRSFSGENSSFSMSGYGYWKEGNLERTWDIRPKVVQKSVR